MVSRFGSGAGPSGMNRIQMRPSRSPIRSPTASCTPLMPTLSDASTVRPSTVLTQPASSAPDKQPLSDRAIEAQRVISFSLRPIRTVGALRRRHRRPQASRSRRSAPSRRSSLESDVGESLPATIAQALSVLLEALDHTPLARLDLGAVFLEIGVALGADVRQGGDRPLELGRCVVERILAARRELVLVRVEACEQPTVSRRDF